MFAQALGAGSVPRRQLSVFAATRDENVAPRGARWSFAVLALVGIAAGAGAGWGVKGRPAGRLLPSLAVAPSARAPSSAGLQATGRSASPVAGTTRDEHASTMPGLPRSARASGHLSVTTDPPGATLLLDGQTIEGRTPVALVPVRADVEHELRARRAGFDDATVRFRVASRETFAVEMKLAGAPLAPLQVTLAEPVAAPSPDAEARVLDGDVNLAASRAARHHHHHNAHHAHHTIALRHHRHGA